MNTKRMLSMMLTIIITLTSFVCSFAAEDAELIINGEKQSGIISVLVGTANNQILAPVTSLCTKLGAECTRADNQAIVTKGDAVIVFTVGSRTVTVNNTELWLPTDVQLNNNVIYVPAEFVGEQLGYHVLRERAGRRVRIISKTSTTAPALKQKSGMAELVSTVHRPVPTSFAKSNVLSVDNLIYNRTDYSDAIGDSANVQIGPRPTGEVIFSQQDFINQMLNTSNIQFDFSKVDVTEKYEGNFLSMHVRMLGQGIGDGNNNVKPLPFTKAVRINSKYDISNAFAAKIEFAKQLPSPEKDDKYVLSYYARIIEGGDPDYGYGKISFSVYGNGDSSLEQVVEITPEWKRYDFLLTGKEGCNQIRFIGAYEKQIIEIGGFEVQNVGKDADVSYFSKTKTDLLPAELSPDAQWRKDAIDRIEQVRKGDFKVKVVDRSGKPVENANVEFDMFEHEFKFGVTTDVEYVDDSDFEGYTFLDADGNKIELSDENGNDLSKFNGNQDEKLRERVGMNFNSTAIGNRLKQGVYVEDAENNPDLPSTARVVMDTAKDLGIKYFRGHALWMPTVDSSGRYPAAMYALLDGLTNDNKEERYSTLKDVYINPHFERMNNEFPEIYEWDVTNETHGRFSFTNAFGMGIFNDIYAAATNKLTNGQERMLCDNRQFEDQYWERLDWFKEEGIEYDSLGMQGHSRIGSYDYDNNFRPQKWLEVWDRFAYEYGKTFAVTEFSVGALNDEYGWDGQGDYMRDILIAAFSHPACTGVNFWWLADYWSEWNSPFRPDNDDYGKKGAGVSPLYGLWFENKPGLTQYHDLLYNKWWTRDVKTTTDANGEGTINGYYGDYDITVSLNGQVVKTKMAAFHKGYENVLTIVVE